MFVSTCGFKWIDKPRNVLIISKIGDANIDKTALETAEYVVPFRPFPHSCLVFKIPFLSNPVKGG